MMEIKVLGSGCSGCKALYESAQQAVTELHLDAVVIKEEDMVRIMEYDVLRLPAMVVDGRVVSYGKRLSVDQVKELLVR